MITIPGKIPVTIRPVFLMVALLIGYMSSGTIKGAFLWMAIIVFSVLFHEFGHALVAYFCKQHPSIELVALGGRTSYEVKDLSLPKQFLIVFGGPFFGFLLFLGAFFLLKTSWFQSSAILASLKIFSLINLFWTLVNLLPIIPLDGGQMVRIGLEYFFGVKGFKASLLLGMLVGLGFGLFFFVGQNFLLGALFFFFSYENFELFRRSKNITPSDRKVEFAQELFEAETALNRGDVDKAKKLLLLIRSQTKKGIIFSSATQYLALLALDDKHRHEAYELLYSIQDSLEESIVPLFHELAFEEKNYPLVKDLATLAFQQKATLDVALRNARAFAALHEAKASGGWLSTAMGFDSLDLLAITKEEIFSSVKDKPEFLHFFKK
jgi:stage IV sporulation protein FB